MDSRASRLFAPYRPRPERGTSRDRILDLVVRDAELRDAAALGALAAEREGRDPARETTAFERQLRTADPFRDRLWVAKSGASVVGFAKAHRFVPPDRAPANVAPEGWYLAGVVVAHAFRRRGVGTSLTLERLRWISRCASRAYYFANALNRASIDLHERLGFTELTRTFWYPGAEFTGGAGILFVRDLTGMKVPAPPA